jgi:hypothetical protein
MKNRKIIIAIIFVFLLLAIIVCFTLLNSKREVVEIPIEN